MCRAAATVCNTLATPEPEPSQYNPLIASTRGGGDPRQALPRARELLQILMFLCVATKRLRMWKALSVNNTIMPTHRAGCRAQNQINFGSRYPYTKNGGRTYPRIRSSLNNSASRLVLHRFSSIVQMEVNRDMDLVHLWHGTSAVNRLPGTMTH